MKLSLIVPVYNTEPYLAQCLDSLLSQSWKDLEIICVNDGSTDGGAQILGGYARRDARIRLIEQKNQGLSAARNAGLQAATGEYICFIDSDDCLWPDACKRLVYEIMGKQPDLIVFGATTMPEEAMKKDPWLRAVLSPGDVMLRDGNLRAAMFQPGVMPFVWRNCIRASLLKEEGLLFDPDVRYGEDTLFQICLLPMCRRISFISDRLYAYRKGRADSLMECVKKGPEKRAELHLPLVEKAAAYWRERGWMQTMGDVFLGWTLEFVAYDVYMAEKSVREPYARRLMALWQENGLDTQPRTRAAQTFILMIHSICGQDGLRFQVMKARRTVAFLVSRLYLMLIGRGRRTEEKTQNQTRRNEAA